MPFPTAVAGSAACGGFFACTPAVAYAAEKKAHQPAR